MRSVFEMIGLMAFCIVVSGLIIFSYESCRESAKHNKHLSTLESRYVLLKNRQDALIRLTDELRQDANDARFDRISQHRRPFIEDMIPGIWDGCGCHGEGE